MDQRGKEVGAETPVSGGGALSFWRDGDGLVSGPLKVGATNGARCLESKRADHLNADLTLVIEASVLCRAQ